MNNLYSLLDCINIPLKVFHNPNAIDVIFFCEVDGKSGILKLSKNSFKIANYKFNILSYKDLSEDIYKRLLVYLIRTYANPNQKEISVLFKESKVKKLIEFKEDLNPICSTKTIIEVIEECKSLICTYPLHFIADDLANSPAAIKDFVDSYCTNEKLRKKINKDLKNLKNKDKIIAKLLDLAFSKDESYICFYKNPNLLLERLDEISKEMISGDFESSLFEMSKLLRDCHDEVISKIKKVGKKHKIKIPTIDDRS